MADTHHRTDQLTAAEEAELTRRIQHDSGARHDLRDVIVELGFGPDELEAENCAETGGHTTL